MLVRLVNISCILAIPTVLFALLVGWFDPGAAATVTPTTTSQVRVFDNGTVRLEKADRPIKKGGRELRYVEFFPTHVYVEFNDGSAWDFARCEFEDSPKCWWDAGHVGNKRGWSFVRYAGRTYYL